MIQVVAHRDNEIYCDGKPSQAWELLKKKTYFGEERIVLSEKEKWRCEEHQNACTFRFGMFGVVEITKHELSRRHTTLNMD